MFGQRCRHIVQRRAQHCPFDSCTFERVSTRACFLCLPCASQQVARLSKWPWKALTVVSFRSVCRRFFSNTGCSVATIVLTSTGVGQLCAPWGGWCSGIWFCARSEFCTLRVSANCRRPLHPTHGRVRVAANYVAASGFRWMHGCCS